MLIGAENYLFFMVQGMKYVDVGEEPFDFITFMRALERIEQCLMPQEGGPGYWNAEPSVFDRKWMLWG